VYRGTPDGRFEDVSAAAGAYFTEKHAGRGAAFGDYDNDGDWDVVIVNNDERAVLLRNDSPRRHDWARLELHGDRCNKAAVGAVITVNAAGRARVLRVPTGGSYLSESDRRLLIAMPEGQSTMSADIRWPCGSTERIEARAGTTTKVLEHNCRLAPRTRSTGQR
jgi:enediyne biosynthesis protein E4